MKSKSNLLTCLSAVEDPRRRQGQRYSISAMLIIIVMCALRTSLVITKSDVFVNTIVKN
ncbi:MAG: transposase family protein [Prevotellaceae bacterium]|nr:transposase family protein [Prevotellaceae bacterium]